MVQVSTEAGFRSALRGQEALIEITDSFPLSSQVQITYEVTIKSEPGSLHKLTRDPSFASYLINIRGGALTLEDIVIDGDKDSHPISDQTNRSLIFLTGGSLTMGNGTILQNNNAYREGGGVYISGATTYSNTMVMRGNARITGCYSDTNGGAIMFAARHPKDSLVISNESLIDNNSAPNGGGLYLRSYDENTSLSAVITGNTRISNNTVTSNGGAIYFSGFRSNGLSSTLTLSGDVSLSANQAESGGGIYFFTASEGDQLDILQGVSIMENTASQKGDGIYNSGFLHTSGSPKVPNGIYITSRNAVVRIEGPLAAGSILQLAQSAYVTPNAQGTPIVVGSAAGSHPLSQPDADAFQKPSQGFVGWEIRLSEDLTQVILAPETYQISYENLMGASNSNPGAYTVTTTDLSLAPPGPLDGYRFIGWFDAQSGGNQVTTIPTGTTGDIFLYARWQPLEPLYLIFKGNNGWCCPKARFVPDPIAVQYGGSATIPTQRPVRTCRKFIGWNTTPSGSGVIYQPGDKISDIQANLKLYAIWKKCWF